MRLRQTRAIPQLPIPLLCEPHPAPLHPDAECTSEPPAFSWTLFPRCSRLQRVPPGFRLLTNSFSATLRPWLRFAASGKNTLTLWWKSGRNTLDTVILTMAAREWLQYQPRAACSLRLCSTGLQQSFVQRSEATLPQGSLPVSDDLFSLSMRASFPSDAIDQRPFFIGGTGKRILGKFLGCNSGASTPSNKLSLWTVRENTPQTCSAPDWWGALRSLSSLQNVLQKWKKRTQH